MSGRFNLISDQRGISFPELTVTVLMGTILMLAAFSLLHDANRSSARNVARIDANQQARPVMERLMDELRSSCLARGTVPIQSGSDKDTLLFLHKTGSSVSPVPDLRRVQFGGTDTTPGSLVESSFVANPQTPNAQGVFSFPSYPGSPASNHTLLSAISRAQIDGSNRNVFRYFTYVNGALTEITSLPLSATDAARTVQVVVTFAVSPLQNPANDPNASVAMSDTALLRFGPPSEIATTQNVPCS
jgi:hypothetical protein